MFMFDFLESFIVIRNIRWLEKSVPISSADHKIIRLHEFIPLSLCTKFKVERNLHSFFRPIMYKHGEVDKLRHLSYHICFFF